MQEVINFDHNEFGRIRALRINQEPWFVAMDVAMVLGYEKTESMTRRLDEDEKGATICRTPGGPQEIIIINEPGLYTAIIGSHKPEAKRFKRWVTHEVLPSIRKYGFYEAGTSDTFRHKKSQHFNLAVSQLCSMTSPKIRARLALRTLAHYTGIPVEDFIEEQELEETTPEHSAHALIQRFVAENCRFGDDLSENATNLYRAFKKWSLSYPAADVSQKKFGAVLSGMYRKAKRGGRFRYFGLQLKNGAAVFQLRKNN